MELPKAIVLKNGLKVASLSTKDVDTITIQLRGKAGSAYETLNNIGTAHLCEHLSIENNKNRLLSLGARVFGVTSRSDVLIMVKIIKENFKETMNFLDEAFCADNFSYSDLETNKKLAIQEVKRIESIPEKLISRISYSILFPNQRMGFLNTGDESQIKEVTLEEIESFKKRFYTPKNFVLVASGNLNEVEFTNNIERHFNNNVVDKKRVSKVNLKPNKNFEILSLKLDYCQQIYVKIDYLAYCLSEDKQYTAKIIAKYVDQLLKKQIKQQLGLSYNISCESFSADCFGILSIYFSCDNNNLNKILDSIKVILLTAPNYISSEILETLKRIYLSEFTFSLEKQSYRTEYYSQYLLHGRSEQTHEYEMNFIKNLTVAEPQNTYNKIFSQQPKISVISKYDMKQRIEELWLK